MDERCHSLGQRCVCFKANQMRVVNIGRKVLVDASPEDDGPLVLLHHLHHEEQGDGERDHDEEQRADGHDEGADAGSLLANCQHSG